MSDQWAKFKSNLKNKRQKIEKKPQTIKNESIIVQRLSAEVSGKAQKYTRVGAREFVPFTFDDITIENIKDACNAHFERGELVCDVLAGEQGPSCSSIKQIPDLKVVYVRFIPEDDDVEEIKTPKKKKARKTILENKVPVTSTTQNTVGQPCIPKSLSVTEMLKLGKLVNNTIEKLDIYEFDIENMCWMQPKSIEFKIDKEIFSSGTFRNAYRARSTQSGFSEKMWVVKRYKEDAEVTITSLNQSLGQHTKKVVQMHNLAKNLTACMKKKLEDDDDLEIFGQTFEYNDIYLGKLNDEFVTVEEFIEGEFQKYINNDGTLNSRGIIDINLSEKAECLVHYSYLKSNKELMLLDIQGCEYKLCDPEIASKTLKSEKQEFLFAVGNLSVCAIDNFVSHHSCNQYCTILNIQDTK